MAGKVLAGVGRLVLAFGFSRGHVAQVANQLIELAVADHACAKCGHASLGPASEVLWVADVLLEEVAAEVFGRVVRNIQVGAEL